MRIGDRVTRDTKSSGVSVVYPSPTSDGYPKTLIANMLYMWWIMRYCWRLAFLSYSFRSIHEPLCIKDRMVTAGRPLNGGLSVDCWPRAKQQKRTMLARITITTTKRMQTLPETLNKLDPWRTKLLGWLVTDFLLLISWFGYSLPLLLIPRCASLSLASGTWAISEENLGIEIIGYASNRYTTLTGLCVHDKKKINTGYSLWLEI